MPQGIVVKIQPNGFVGDTSGLTDEEILLRGCKGLVFIEDGDYADRLGYFEQTGNCCSKRKGQTVEINVIGEGKGGLQVELINC